MNKPRRRWLLRQVSEFFSVMRCNDDQARRFGGDEAIPRVRSWDHTDPTTAELSGDRQAPRTYVCDEVDGLVDNLNPHHWEDGKYARWDELHGGRIRCCLRAGLDVACEPSGGVIGFTVGDMKRLYPRGIPTWIKHPHGGWRDSRGRFVNIEREPATMGLWL